MNRPHGVSRIFASVFLLVFIGLVATLAFAWSALPLEHTTVSVDGRTVALSGLSGWHAALAIVAAAAAVLVALIVAALAVVFAFGVAAFGIAIALFAVVATVGLVASPLIFIGWLVWRIVRPASRQPAIAA